MTGLFLNRDIGDVRTGLTGEQQPDPRGRPGRRRGTVEAGVWLWHFLFSFTLGADIAVDARRERMPGSSTSRPIF
jgi:hypothetical protein